MASRATITGTVNNAANCPSLSRDELQPRRSDAAV
jgi:hypothetical protein